MNCEICGIKFAGFAGAQACWRSHKRHEMQLRDDMKAVAALCVWFAWFAGFVERYAPPKSEPLPNYCNRHKDCASATTSCCHSDDCEECFGC